MNPESEDKANGSIKPGEPVLMSREDQAAVFKFPCDGAKRYSVSHPVKLGGLTYSEAYDIIFSTTGCKDVDGKRVLTLLGVERLKNINRKYLSVAGTFVREWFAEQKRLKAEAATAAPKQDEAPKTEEPKNEN